MTTLSWIKTVPAVTVLQGEIGANLHRHAGEARGAFSPHTERALRADVSDFHRLMRRCGPPGPASLAGDGCRLHRCDGRPARRQRPFAAAVATPSAPQAWSRAAGGRAAE